MSKKSKMKKNARIAQTDCAWVHPKAGGPVKGSVVVYDNWVLVEDDGGDWFMYPRDAISYMTTCDAYPKWKELLGQDPAVEEDDLLDEHFGGCDGSCCAELDEDALEDSDLLGLDEIDDCAS